MSDPLSAKNLSPGSNVVFLVSFLKCAFQTSDIFHCQKIFQRVECCLGPGWTLHRVHLSYNSSKLDQMDAASQ